MSAGETEEDTPGNAVPQNGSFQGQFKIPFESVRCTLISRE